MNISDKTIELITQKIMDSLNNNGELGGSNDNLIKEDYYDPGITLEISARHVHLAQEQIDALFGKGYKLNVKRELLQPNEFLAEERVILIGPKGGVIQNVAVLGPVRPDTQIEISPSDAKKLGLKAPVKNSGDVSGTPGLIMASANGIVVVNSGVMLAKRHIHMTPKDADYFNLNDKDIVKVAVNGYRPLIFDDVLVRVSEKFILAMHIDTDEAGACGAERDTEVEILKEGCCDIKMQIGNVVTMQGTSDSPEKEETTGKLVTEEYIRKLISSGKKQLTVSRESIVTSLAYDLAKTKKIEIIRI
jgi:putative phosphotransacetylase